MDNYYCSLAAEFHFGRRKGSGADGYVTIGMHLCEYVRAHRG